MGRMVKYLLIMSGMVFLFYLAGLLGETPHNLLLDLLLNPEDVEYSSLMTQSLLVLEGILGIGGAIIIGYVTRNYELALMAPYVTFLAGLAFDFWSVFQIMYGYAPFFTVIIFSPIFLIFTMTIVDYWRGKD